MGSLSLQKAVVLWGGVGSGAVLSEAWKWDGTNWSQIVSPGARADAAAIDVGSRVVFFGGDGPNAPYHGLQEFDGINWFANA